MEKDQFNLLLSNYTSLSAEEARQLISLQQEFPYSQVIHGLTARAAQDNQVDGKESHLHLSAIYSTDRAVLKSIMTSPRQSRKQVLKTESEKPTLSIKPQEAPPVLEEVKPQQPLPEREVVEITISSALSSDELYDEVMHDVEILRERKLQFELAVSNLEMGSPVASDLSRSKKGKTMDPEDGLIQEIKTSKKKIKPEGPKQKEQIEIIDQFIKTQPTISKNKLAASIASESKGDLSENSLTYGENIVSETLVQILLKQGKKEKAIEVLKKLIWKFPQKKAYFAAQIEDLKK